MLISQQPTPICLPGQLAVDYRGVGDGAGEEFANFFIRDTSRSACTLLGPVSVVGVDAAGHPVTDRETYPVGSDVELTANTAKVPDSAAVPAGTVVGWFQLSTAAIHDFDNGCPQIVTPTSWSVTIAGGTNLAPNKPDTFAACQANSTTPYPKHQLPRRPTEGTRARQPTRVISGCLGTQRVTSQHRIVAHDQRRGRGRLRLLPSNTNAKA